LALDAVITDARGMGADRFWLLGDLVAMGPDPVGTVQRLRRLEPEFRITGNTDRLVSRAEKPYPSATEQGLEADVVDRATRRAAMLAWTRGALATSGDLEWLADSSPTRRRRIAAHWPTAQPCSQSMQARHEIAAPASVLASTTAS
jgi:hypothetical protein